MKKFFICFILCIFAYTCKAQSDTLIVSKPITFDSEVIVSKSGKTYEKYYAIYENEYYDSTKVSCERYYTISRFGGKPCVALIVSGKTKKKRIIVL